MPMPGDVVAHLADRLGEDPGSAVGQVVAGHARHDDVLEAHRPDRLGDAARLVGIEPGGPAGLHGTEPAGPGAGVAQDHDRGRALVPALPDVGAVGLLADRVEAEAAHQALELVVVLAGRHPGTDPVGMAPGGAAAAGRRTAVESAAHRDRQLRARMRAGAVVRGRTSEALEPSSGVYAEGVDDPLLEAARGEAEFARGLVVAREERTPGRPRSSRAGSAGMPGRPPSRSLIGAISRSRPVGTVMPRRLVAADARRDRDRRLEGMRLAADDVGLADPATIEGRDDPGGRVVDVGHLEGDLGQREVAERAAIRRRPASRRSGCGRRGRRPARAGR